MGKKKTHDQYVDEVAKINPDIEVVGKYINSSRVKTEYSPKWARWKNMMII